MSAAEEQLSRPHFFPGLPIDYRDFNRLSHQADRVQSVLCKSLYPEGGIFLGVGSEFRVEIISEENFEVRICPGVGLLPSGELVKLRQDVVVKISDYDVGNSNQNGDENQGSTLVFGLTNRVRGTQSFKDESDPAISGFRSEVLEPELTVGRSQLPSNSIEVFRIRMGQNHQSHKQEIPVLRFATEAETWETSEESPTLSALDFRFRRQILSPTYRPLGPIESLRIREQLFQCDESFRKLIKLFSVDGDFQFRQLGSSLHASLLELPFQAMKVGYLVSEFSFGVSELLNAIHDQVPRSREDLDRELLLELMEKSKSLVRKSAMPRQVDFQTLTEVLKGFNRLVKNAESKYNLMYLIQDSLSDLARKSFDYSSEAVFAGTRFKRISLLNVSDLDHTSSNSSRTIGHQPRFEVVSKDQLKRVVRAQYGDGKFVEQSGVFLSNGRITLKFNLADSSRPAVILMRHYSRRRLGEVQFLLNGKILSKLGTKNSESNGKTGTPANQWENLGWLLPSEKLIVENNQLTILVKDSCLDFGFFQMAVYQTAEKRI